MKNLIIIHLESISKLSYRIFENEFPALNTLSQKSVCFENFFSSASSTLMAVTDMFHGNSFEMDNLPFLSSENLINRSKNIYELLADNGYNVKALWYTTKKEELEKGINIWSKNLEKVYATNVLSELEKKVDEYTDKKPFALHLCDLVCHISHSDDFTDNSKNYTEKYSKACAHTDNFVDYIFKLLERKGLLDDTVIVAYGDHGDDYWTHGYNRGYIHILEPYTRLIHTPLIVYSKDLKPEKIYKLASTVDIKRTCLGLLGIKDPDDFEYRGIDLFKETNDVVYSQNLMTNQRYHPTLPLRKAYSVINDFYNLIVTESGLEMYAYRLDITNHCNLLNFFSLDKKGFIHFKKPSQTSGHFDEIFLKTDKNIKDIEKNFYELRNLLKERVKTKNNMVQAKKKTLLSLKSFEKLNHSDKAKFFCPKIKLNIYKLTKLIEQKIRQLRKRALKK